MKDAEGECLLDDIWKEAIDTPVQQTFSLSEPQPAESLNITGKICHHCFISTSNYLTGALDVMGNEGNRDQLLLIVPPKLNLGKVKEINVSGCIKLKYDELLCLCQFISALSILVYFFAL